MIPFNGRPDSGVTNLTAYKRGPGPDRGSINAALSNPTLSTSQISLQSNVTTSLPLMVRPWRHGWEKNFNEGSILFVHTGQADHRMTTTLDVPSLNFVFQQAVRTVGRSSFNLDNNDLYPRPKDENGADIEFTNQHFKFGFFGVVRNDLMANSNLQKLYNCDVFGRTMVANIFSGDKLKRGDHVGLAICVVDIHQMYGFFEQPDGSRIPNVVTDEECYQILGTRNGLLCGHSTLPQDSPDPVEQKPHGENKVGGSHIVKRILRHIPLGVVSHAVARIPSVGAINAALRSQDKMTLLPRVEVLLN